VPQLAAEFVSSGMRRSEFCQSQGLSFSLWIAIEEAALKEMA
jgi:hypothetical protein